MRRHMAPRKKAGWPAQGSVSTTSWQCRYPAELEHIRGCFFSFPTVTKFPSHEDEAMWSLIVPKILCNISILPLCSRLSLGAYFR